MGKRGIPHINASARRLLRIIVPAALLALAAMLLAAGSAWLKVIGPPKVVGQYLAVWFLAAILDSYFWVWAIALSGAALSGWLVWRLHLSSRAEMTLPIVVQASRLPARERQARRLHHNEEIAQVILARARSGRASHQVRSRWQAAALRCLVLCISCICGLGLAEAAAAAWLAWLHRLPAMPVRYAESKRPAGEYSIVVIGGSSALGVPYEDWLSVGTIVGCELERAIPASRFRVDVLAERGATLEDMHRKLSRLTRKPDMLIVYSGHNEFLARFSPANQVYYYDDDQRLTLHWARLEHTSRASPFLTLVRENLERQRVRVLPIQSVGMLERAVGRPVCEPASAAQVFAAFHQRLEAIVSDCERIGCLPVLIIPPGNDAADPTRSCASPSTSAELRHVLARRMQVLRPLERDDPAKAATGYQQVVSEQSGFAHAQHRLARLLEKAGSYREAQSHYILARDHDGLPLRCVSALEAAYRSVAQRHESSVVLVDGPAVLRAKSRHGILDDALFHDLVHPTLTGHVALAEAVLAGLKDRGAFGWPAAKPAPALDPKCCAAQFGIDASAWATVCQRSAAQYEMICFLTVDPQERIRRRDQLLATVKQIRAGASLQSLSIPGFE